MRAFVATMGTIMLAAVLGFAAGCGAHATPATLVATAPDGVRIAVASSGARNVRVLHVSGGSIVRLREVFVPEGEAIAAIGWSDDGRSVIVTTRGPQFAIDTRTWRVDGGSARAHADAARHTSG
jgi:hypothetical protein